MSRRWPETMAEFERERDAATEKYRPLVARLPIGELFGLHLALGEAIEKIKAEARAEDIRHGWRPPGTSIGR